MEDIDNSNFFYMGRMLSGSKSGYSSKHPLDLIIFNANICTRSSGKIWYGDLNVTLDAEKLKEFAKATGEDLYILREMDARFQFERNPQFDHAVAIVKPTGEIHLTPGKPYR